MVLNNRPGISDKTRERVLNAAQKYGYDFSRIDGRAAAEGSIQLIIYKKHGIVVSDTPFFSQLVESIEQGCRDAHLTLQITYFHATDKLDECVQRLKKSNCDGILILGTEMGYEELMLLSDIDMPIVVLDTYFDDIDLDFVKINNRGGMAKAIKHLVSSGFSEIGYLHSSYSIVNFREREEGYHNALAMYGIEYMTADELTPTIEGAYNDMKKRLDNGKIPFHAYVADNDLIAIGAMKAFREYGYNIPGDISIVGFDNMPVCDVTEPPLTTMNVQKRLFGAMGLQRLIQRINDSDGSFIKIELMPETVVRKSTRKK